MTSYLLDASLPERQRLIAQGDFFQGEAEWLLDSCGLKAGQRVLDLGCGPLGILHLLADRVGASGAVVGIDADTNMVVAARAATSNWQPDNVTIIEGRADQTGQRPASFDLAHTRLLLVNVPNPAEVVAHMTALVRSGGYVAVQDIDWANRLCEPAHPAWDRIVQVIIQLWHADGQDVFIGRKLPGAASNGRVHGQ